MTRSLLLVDGDETGNKLVTIVLREEGWVVMAATTGAEAIAMLRAVTPRLIVVELVLPDIDGLELLRIVRATPATEAIPVAVFTSVNGTATEQRVREAGAAAYIKKPIDVLKFAAQLEPLVRAP